MQEAPRYLPAHLNVEEDVGPIKSFIQDTNCVIMRRHGFSRCAGATVFRRPIIAPTCSSPRLKRNIIVEMAQAP